MTYRAKYLVLFCNSGGELDRRYAHNEEDAAHFAADMIREAGELHDGDKIIVQEIP